MFITAPGIVPFPPLQMLEVQEAIHIQEGEEEGVEDQEIW